MPGVVGVVHGVAVAAAVIVSRYQSEVRMAGIHPGVDDRDHDAGVSISVIPGLFRVGIESGCADCRAGVAGARYPGRELSGVVVAPVVAIIGIVGNGLRVSKVFQIGILDLGVGQKVSQSRMNIRAAVQHDDEPAVETRGLFPVQVIHPAMGALELVCSVALHGPVQAGNAEFAFFGVEVLGQVGPAFG